LPLRPGPAVGNRDKRSQEDLALAIRQAFKKHLIRASSCEHGGLQDGASASCQSYFIAPGILFASRSTQEPLAEEARNKFSQGRAVDAGALYDFGLAQHLSLGDASKHSELSRRKLR
jgi:hypothetical protein